MATILQHARAQLTAGTDLREVHGAIDRAARHMEDVEAYALLAEAGHRAAQEAIEQRIAQLERLRDGMGGQED
jgi:hypothetical protein